MSSQPGVASPSFGFSRSTLVSLITIVSTLAIFATGATFALSGSDSASGTVSSGAFAINLNVAGTGPAEALAFTTGSPTCPLALQPGQFCTATVNVTNNSGFQINLGFPSVPGGVASTTDAGTAGCSNSDWPVEFDQSNFLTTLTPGETTSFIVKVTLSATAPAGCENETATVNVTVGASA